jgi:hypothetical protein
MLAQLQTWMADGSHRRKANPAATQYVHAAAVAIADEIMPKLIRALYDPILAAGGLGTTGATGGVTSQSYKALPMLFVDSPDGGGAHNGSSYDGGFESYLVTSLEQLLGLTPADAFGSAVTSRECGAGPSSCPAAIDAALLASYNSLLPANGSSNVATWTASTASKSADQTMPQFDSISFKTLGLVGQPAVDWQNRPTFQQVIQFARHRPR